MAWVLRPAVVCDATDGHLMAIVPKKNFVLKHFDKQETSLSVNLMLAYYKMSREQELQLIFLLVLDIWGAFVLITYLRASTFS